MSKYRYDHNRSADENTAMALYAIANELNALGIKDATDRRGALELLSEEVHGVQKSLGHIAEAISNMTTEMVADE